MSVRMLILPSAEKKPASIALDDTSLTKIHWGALALFGTILWSGLLGVVQHGGWGVPAFIIVLCTSFFSCFAFATSICCRGHVKYVLCAMLVKFSRGKSIYRFFYFFVMKVAVRFLPFHSYSEPVGDCLCYALAEYWKSRGKGERGLRIFQMKYTKSFFHPDASEKTVYRHLKDMTVRGEAYFL